MELIRVFGIFHFVLCFFFVTSTSTSTKSLNLRSPITRIATSRYFMEIYVGGENFIAALSENLDLILFISIGPVNEPKDCYPNPAPCSNTVQVLELDETLNKLIVCGSAYGGTCTAHDLPLIICNWMCLDSITNTSRANIISSSGGHQMTTHFLPLKDLKLEFEPVENFESSWEECRSYDFASQCNMAFLENRGPRSHSHPESDTKHGNIRKARSPGLQTNNEEIDSITNMNWNVPGPSVEVIDGMVIGSSYDLGNTFLSPIIVGSHQDESNTDMPQSPLISMRYVFNVMEESFFVVYPGEDSGKPPPGIYVDENKRKTFSADFKLSFSKGDFSYLLSVQKGFCSYKDGYYQKSCTMFSRVNNTSPSLLPYIEIPLRCNHQETDFPLLTAATLGVVGLLKGSQLEHVNVLLLAFGRGEKGDTEPKPKYGTAICAHTLNSLDKFEFDYTEKFCTQMSPSPPKWAGLSNPPCQLIREETFGGDQTSIGFIPNTLVSSLQTHTQAVRKEMGIAYLEQMYVYAVTTHDSRFKLGKYFELTVSKRGDQYTIGHKNLDTSKTILEQAVDGRVSYPPVGKVNHMRAKMYLTYDTKVYALNLDFCRKYTSCSRCQKLGGGQCRWCPGEESCMDRGMDSCKVSSEGSCPPRIYDFQPKEIPVSGGSTLTIRGSHLGSQADGANVSVTICGQPCDGVFANVNSLTCTVRSKPKGPVYEECSIRVSVTGSKDSNGEEFSPSRLKYVTPNVTVFSPEFGPVSGRTFLEIWGDHLLVGTKQRVEVAGVQCDVLPLNFKEGEKLICRLNAAAGLEDQCGKVKVIIDNYEMEANVYEYCFKADPIISHIRPMSTIESGGIKLHVTGQHFNSTPIISLMIVVQEGQHTPNERMTYRGVCTKVENAESLECITPSLRNVTKHVFDNRPDTDEIQASIAFSIGSSLVKSRHQSYFFIHRDPIVFHLQDGTADSYIHGSLKDNLFRIAGKFIPYWIDPSEIEIMVGQARCPVRRMSLFQIFCDVTEVLQTYQRDFKERMKTSTTPSPSSSSSSSNTTTSIITSDGDRLKTNDTTTLPTTTSETVSLGNRTTLDPNNTKTNGTSLGDSSLAFEYIHPAFTGEFNRFRTSSIHLENPIVYPLKIKIGNWKQKLGFVSVGPLLSSDPDDEDPKANKRAASWVPKLAGIAGGAFVVVLVPALCYVFYLRRRRRKRKRREEHPYYMGSMSGRSASHTGSGEPAVPSLAQILNSVLEPSKRDAATKLIISLDQLTLGSKVGSGNFGCVYEGLLTRGKEPHLKVAVKTLQDPVSHSINLTGFVQEAVIMMDFSHENVLGLVGLAEKEPGVPYVILPFIENGDLLTYVRDPKRSLNLYDVIQFGADICNGMAYLSSLKFVHRDLAARNCMLDQSYRVKVADFGLCRDIYEKGYYTSDNKKKLPIRWMAVESIENGAYSSKSDVWSMGVVLWELLTRGMTPYPGVDGWDIINFLRRRRLAPPRYCPDNLYRLMMTCWAKDPARRPSFKALQKELLLMIGMEVVSCPNTPEAARNMRIFPPNSHPSPTINGPHSSRIEEPDYLIPLIKISQVGQSNSHNSLEKGSDEEKNILERSKISGSVMSLPRSNLVKNVKITIPSCYEFRDVKKEAVAEYIQIVDNYEPPPRFANPFLRSKKKRNKSSKKSKEKNSQEIEKSQVTETNNGDYKVPNSERYSVPPGSTLPTPKRSFTSGSRRCSEGQLIDMVGSKDHVSHTLGETSPYYVLEHNQGASGASILASSCHSSVAFDKTGSMGSILDRYSGASSMASLASSNASFPSSNRPHSGNTSSGFIHMRSSLNSRHGDKANSFGQTSVKEEDVIEM